MITFYDEYIDGLLGGNFSTFRKNLGNKLFIYGVSRVAADIMDYDLIESYAAGSKCFGSI